MDRRVLKGALGRFYSMGFRIIQGEDIVVLAYEGWLIGRYNATKVTVEELRAGCQQYLEERPALLERI